jgi:hypothetical protein
MKPTLNKWQFWFKPFEKNRMRMDPPGWYAFDLGLINLHSLPENGARITKKHYKGFAFRFLWWLPFDRA